jgi:predicted glutamine amidotransferase
MCNLNVVLKNKDIKLRGIHLERITTLSYAGNSDGDGVYYSFQNALFKDIRKHNYTKDDNYIINSNAIISHQRLATNGTTTKENTHPFKSKNWTMAHNGILSGEHINKNENDSRAFFRTLLKNGLENTTEDTEVSKIIDTTLKDFYGSFSIILYNQATNKAYYFKNYTPNIYFFRLKHNGYFITTQKGNAVFIEHLIKKEIKAEDNILYCFKQEGNIWKLTTIGKIESRGYYPSHSYNDYGTMGNNPKYYDYEDYWNFTGLKKGDKQIKLTEQEQIQKAKDNIKGYTHYDEENIESKDKGTGDYTNELDEDTAYLSDMDREVYNILRQQYGEKEAKASYKAYLTSFGNDLILIAGIGSIRKQIEQIKAGKEIISQITDLKDAVPTAQADELLALIEL